jgi:outer membrane immunogenic protein
MFRNVLLSSAALIALSGAALAADLPSTRAPAAPPPIPVFSWSGLYAGGQIGYAFGDDADTRVITSVSTSPSGVLGGAHIGYNFEPALGGIVLGLEGDVNGSSYTATSANYYTIKSPVNGSIRARAGFAVDRALFYATGGAAFASFNDSYVFSGDSSSTTRVGYTVGGGIEYAVTNEWSVRAEYRYNNFGTFTDTLPIAGTTVSHKETENQVLAGFSYKFASPVAPVVARY